MDTLKSLCADLNSFTDKDTVHCYLDVYDHLFLPYKDKEINFLEIGTDRGGSLMLWDKYFPNANIYGLDIKHPDLEIPSRVNFYQSDATDSNCLNLFPENIKFDIVIEDASHLLEHQILTYSFMKNRMNNGGLFIIEDIQEYGIAKMRMQQYFGDFDVYDLRYIKNRYDDILFVFKH
mgnify:FL=1|jgi:hypothetical protein